MDDLGGPVFFGNITYRIHFATSSLNLKIHQPFCVASWSKQPAALHLGEKRSPPVFEHPIPTIFGASCWAIHVRPQTWKITKKTAPMGSTYRSVGFEDGWSYPTWKVIGILDPESNKNLWWKYISILQKFMGSGRKMGWRYLQYESFCFISGVVFHFSTEPWWEKE